MPAAEPLFVVTSTASPLQSAGNPETKRERRRTKMYANDIFTTNTSTNSKRLERSDVMLVTKCGGNGRQEGRNVVVLTN